MRAQRYDDDRRQPGAAALGADRAARARRGATATTATASASRWPRGSTTCVTRSIATLHAIARNRMLTGLALGYAPQGAPDFGLDRARLRAAGRALRACCCTPPRGPKRNGRRRTGSRSARALAARGLRLVLPWGTRGGAARSRAHRRAAAARAGAGAAAARSGRADDRRRAVRGRRRYRPAASRRRARRAAGRDLHRQRAGPHRPGRRGPIDGARRATARRRRSRPCRQVVDGLLG